MVRDVNRECVPITVLKPELARDLFPPSPYPLPPPPIPQPHRIYTWRGPRPCLITYTCRALEDRGDMNYIDLRVDMALGTAASLLGSLPNLDSLPRLGFVVINLWFVGKGRCAHHMDLGAQWKGMNDLGWGFTSRWSSNTGNNHVRSRRWYDQPSTFDAMVTAHSLNSCTSIWRWWVGCLLGRWRGSLDRLWVVSLIGQHGCARG